jgi:hypothetical protein
MSDELQEVKQLYAQRGELWRQTQNITDKIHEA